MRRLVLPILAAMTTLMLGLPGLAAAAPTNTTGPAPLGGGSRLHTADGARCHAAFAATGGGAGYLIAGPGCAADPGTTVYSGDDVVVGPVAGVSARPTVVLVRVTNTTDWELVPWVDGTIPVRGSTEAPVGASVCMPGWVSGWQCGVLQAKNQTIRFPEGTVTGISRTSVCAEPGDTGAPLFSGDQAQGVLIGGSGNCSTGGTTFFQPINPILSSWGLALLTG